MSSPSQEAEEAKYQAEHPPLSIEERYFIKIEARLEQLEKHVEKIAGLVDSLSNALPFLLTVAVLLLGFILWRLW